MHIKHFKKLFDTEPNKLTTSSLDFSKMEKDGTGHFISHTTFTTFNFWDRIRILFGKMLRVDSKIQVDNENARCVSGGLDIVSAKVEPFFKPKKANGNINR